MKKQILLLLLAIVLTTATSFAETYQIDPTRTQINFSIKHLVFLTAHGHFKNFTGAVQADFKNRVLTKANATILATSIETNLEKRDKYLRSQDFLDVDRYPEITFKSKKITGSGDNITAVGDLTIKEITKEITLAGHFLKTTDSSQEEFGAGFIANGVITRDDFALSQKTSTKVMLGNKIKIELKVMIATQQVNNQSN